MYFADDFVTVDPTEYVTGEIVNVKTLTTTPSGILNLDDVDTQQVEIKARANRPYPPAQVKINGQYFPSAQLSAVSISWVHRNRVQQTGGELLGFEDGGVTPEDGTTYRVELFYPAMVSFYLKTGIEGTSFNIPQNVLPFDYDYIFVAVSSERDGFVSYQSHLIQINLFRKTGDNIVFVMDQANTPSPGDAIKFIL